MTWTYINGSAKADDSVLRSQALSPFEDNYSPPAGPADQTISLAINQTDIVTWMVAPAPFTEPKVPIIYGDVSDGWESNTTMHLPLNSTIDIVMRISNQSMDMVRSPMPVPLSIMYGLLKLTTGRWVIQCISTATNSGFWDQVLDPSRSHLSRMRHRPSSTFGILPTATRRVCPHKAGP